MTFGTWILADHLELSPIMAVAGLAALVAHRMPERTKARDRINSNAVWVAVIFVLNVLAFLLMGLQARIILTQLQGAALVHALKFAGLVLATVILVRFAWVMTYGSVVRRFHTHLARRAAAPCPRWASASWSPGAACAGS